MEYCSVESLKNKFPLFEDFPIRLIGLPFITIYT